MWSDSAGVDRRGSSTCRNTYRRECSIVSGGGREEVADATPIRQRSYCVWRARLPLPEASRFDASGWRVPTRRQEDQYAVLEASGDAAARVVLKSKRRSSSDAHVKLAVVEAGYGAHEWKRRRTSHAQAKIRPVQTWGLAGRSREEVRGRGSGRSCRRALTKANGLFLHTQSRSTSAVSGGVLPAAEIITGGGSNTATTICAQLLT